MKLKEKRKAVEVILNSIQQLCESYKASVEKLTEIDFDDIYDNIYNEISQLEDLK